MAEVGKRAQASAKTRDQLIETALALYGERSIDAVSLREITAAAGQKNPNALQYHFGDRDGLLQAIIDKHAPQVADYRRAYVARGGVRHRSPAQRSARTLVLPIVDYIKASASGASFVKVVSQITAVYQNGSSNAVQPGIQFPESDVLKQAFALALKGLSAREAQHRVYLAVTTSFHTLADIYREGVRPGRGSGEQTAMVEQLICLLESYLAAAPRVKP